MKPKAAVIYHKVDFDGMFSGAMCQHFLSFTHEVTMFPYDYGEPDPLFYRAERDKGKTAHEEWDVIYIVDVSADFVLQSDMALDLHRVIWIDHHKTAIEKYDPSILGLRIDGVAACRLCWQWFTGSNLDKLTALSFSPKGVGDPTEDIKEPLAVYHVGRFDVWDHSDARTIPFQYGLKAWRIPYAFDRHDRTDRAFNLNDIKNFLLLDEDKHLERCNKIIADGRVAERFFVNQNEKLVADVGRHITFEGVRFFAMNSTARVSLALEPGITDKTQALLSWYWTGDHVRVSLYGCKQTPSDLDLSVIAKIYGGGGHRGACGFQCNLATLQEILNSNFSIADVKHL